LRGRRFTQDTPVLPDVWMLFGTKPGQSHDLILTPHKHSSVEKLFVTLRRRAERESAGPRGEGREFKLSYNESHVFFRTDYEGLVRIVLPVSFWWGDKIKLTSSEIGAGLVRLEERTNLVDLLTDASTVGTGKIEALTQPVLDMIRIVGCIGLVQRRHKNPEREFAGDPLSVQDLRSAIQYLQETLVGLELYEPSHKDEVPPLWNLFSDRLVSGAINRSRLAVKADAAIELFKTGAVEDEICWAVVDSGIDARHPAFWKNAAPAQNSKALKGDFCGPTRVEKTLDFTRLSGLTSITISGGETRPPALKGLSAEQKERIGNDLSARLQNGQPLDWAVLETALEVPHDENYQPPATEHGTHVAGILGANWPVRDEPPLVGICPGIRLYDLRVVSKEEPGKESIVLAALQYVRYLNANKGRLVVHGVNLSCSLAHKVESFACGRTPVCEEANRLVGNGIVVVAAAGNSGMGGQGVGVAVDYRAISITDPGNAEDVITVGSTHNRMPHRFGVSYFSSRGPTGDGRMKPDLVAPGEQILSTTPDRGAAKLDGTSMAAPHVSGAAALLMARHPELRGEPRRIKEILCRTATDLGRERSFQGAGMLDILRALQSV
jgi:hypothetical protein